MRERLIGAIVLVVVAIIAVPWLVSRAHHPEEVVTHKPWPASASTPQQPYVLPLRATHSVAARKGAGGSPGTAASTQTQARPAQSSAAPVTHAKTQVAQVPVSQPPVKQKSASTKTSDIKQGVTSQGWSIQAASFSDVKSARELASRLKQAGFKVGLASHLVKGTRYYQVRVGPYSSEKLARDAVPGVARISNTKVLVRAPGSDNG
jgi:DedD protein